MHKKCLDSNDVFHFYSLFNEDWNYNYLLLEPNSDIYNNYKPFKESSYNGMKHNINLFHFNHFNLFQRASQTCQ